MLPLSFVVFSGPKGHNPVSETDSGSLSFFRDIVFS